MAKKQAENKAEEPKVPTSTFQVEEGGKKYKFNVAAFRMPGNNEPILAVDALKDEDLLAKLVEMRAGVIEEAEA